MITIQFPDNTKKEFPIGSNVMDVAQDISEGLARNVLAATINDISIDLQQPLEGNKILELKLFTWKDKQGKSTMWHSTAHLMAEAIEHFYPNVKFAIGPSIDNGFYYDLSLIHI